MKGANASAKGKEQKAGSSVRGNRRRQEDQGKGNVQSRSKAPTARRKDEEASDQVAQEEVSRIDPYVVEYAVLSRYVSAYVESMMLASKTAPADCSKTTIREA
jgi:hypothetical protein